MKKLISAIALVGLLSVSSLGGEIPSPGSPCTGENCPPPCTENCQQSQPLVVTVALVVIPLIVP